jgi:hypothetical protein
MGSLQWSNHLIAAAVIKWLKPGCDLCKYVRKCPHIDVLARALVMLAKNLGIFPTVQLARKYLCTYWHPGFKALQLTI